MPFDVSGLTRQTPLTAWVPYDKDASVLVEYIGREDIIAIGKQATMTTVRNGQKSEEYDPVLASVMLGRRVIKDWKGFTENGQPFLCTPENIELLMRKSGQFARFVDEACTNLQKITDLEKEETAKNSGNTSGQD